LHRKLCLDNSTSWFMMQFCKLIYPLLDGMRVTCRILLDEPSVNGTNGLVITHIFSIYRVRLTLVGRVSVFQTMVVTWQVTRTYIRSGVKW
jgi:hypothetical protein